MHLELNALVILGLIDIILDSVQPSPVIFCGLDNLCFVLSPFLWPQYIMIRWKDNKWLKYILTCTALLRKQLFSPGALRRPLELREILAFLSRVSYQLEGMGWFWCWGRPPGGNVSGFSMVKKITSQLMIFSTSFIAKNLKKE